MINDIIKNGLDNLCEKVEIFFNKYYRDKDLETIIYAEIRKLKSDPMYLEKLRDSVDHTAVLQGAEARIEAIDKQLAKIMDLYTIGALDLNIVKEKAQALSDEKKALETEVEEHKMQAMAQLSPAEVVDLVKLFEDAIASGDTANINNAICEIIDFIEIEHEKIKIHWRF